MSQDEVHMTSMHLLGFLGILSRDVRVFKRVNNTARYKAEN